MNEKLTVQISADIDSLKAELKKAGYELKKFSDGANNASQHVSNSFLKITDSLKNLALSYVSLQAATSLLGSSFDRALKLDAINASMTAITGSSELAAQQFQKLSDFANQYGLNLIAVADSYKNFSASATMANVPLEQTDYIFQSVAKAASVLKLSNEDLKGALNALSQMISKGTVQSEELRGQLGERLPGAFNLAAKAMGVTTQELGKMLERGDVMAGDLLPKLALELNNTFGDKIIGNVDNLQASINRLDNSFTLAVRNGNIGIFFKEIVDGANEAIKILDSKSWNEFFGRIAALATGNEALKFKLDATTLALKQLNKEAEKTKSISDLTKSFGTTTTKKSGRSPQEAMLPMVGASELKNEAKALFDLYKQTPDTLKTMGDAYANNPFFRDLINGDIAEQTKKTLEDLRGLKETKDTFGNNSIQLVSPEQLANMQNMVTLLGGALTSAFDAALISGQNFGQVLIKAIGDLIKKLLAAVATAAILSVILNAFPGGGAAVNFKEILSKLTGFNFGGKPTGNKVLSSVPQRTNEGAVSFEIRGDKLYGVLQNYNQRLNLLA
jgi:tape measure domain-containing protein